VTTDGNSRTFLTIPPSGYDLLVRDLAAFVVHVLATRRSARLIASVRVMAESLLLKQQLLILNRSKKRSPRLGLRDRVIGGVYSLLMRPSRFVRVALVLKPSTLLRFHRALATRKYRQLFSPRGRRKPCASRNDNSRVKRRIRQRCSTRCICPTLTRE
jgi:hypothetical protein